MKRSIRSATFAGGLLLICCIGSCQSREPTTAATEQALGPEACEAGEYWGTGDADCYFRAYPKGTGIVGLSTCEGPTKRVCHFDWTCEWKVDNYHTVTDCILKSDACGGVPPEASLSDPPPLVIDLGPNGNCDPDDDWNKLWCSLSEREARWAATSYCMDQTDRNHTTRECCMECPDGHGSAGSAMGGIYGVSTSCPIGD